MADTAPGIAAQQNAISGTLGSALSYQELPSGELAHWE